MVINVRRTTSGYEFHHPKSGYRIHLKVPNAIPHDHYWSRSFSTYAKDRIAYDADVKRNSIRFNHY